MCWMWSTALSPTSSSDLISSQMRMRTSPGGMTIRASATEEELMVKAGETRHALVVTPSAVLVGLALPETGAVAVPMGSSGRQAAYPLPLWCIRLVMAPPQPGPLPSQMTTAIFG
uniref:Uncharacterized protein n=1 Tax=Triticum urartu TaxID=4572 RepID=A0A8R7TKX6_TRIUA